MRDISDVKLLPDHRERYFWIDFENNHILFERLSPNFPAAERFLTKVSEPVSRTQNLHEYVITEHSLFAALSSGLTATSIIQSFSKYTKFSLSPSFVKFIESSAKCFGKVRIILQNRKYFIEINDSEIYKFITNDALIRLLLLEPDLAKEISLSIKSSMEECIRNEKRITEGFQHYEKLINRSKKDVLPRLIGPEDTRSNFVEIPPQNVQLILRRCHVLKIPVFEEYDFCKDRNGVNLKIFFKPQSYARSYQREALANMFHKCHARSGIIVLPCGAGKTFVGVAAACIIQKSVIVLCTNTMSVVQWRNEFIRWSTIDPSDVSIITSDQKSVRWDKSGVIITTYSMVVQCRGRSYESKKIMKFIEEKEWGLMLLDEAHVVPADTFKKVTSNIRVHTKLGLTATLLREDGRIHDLNYLIGPKLYEANWHELAESGHISRVQCAEVWCPMTAEFFLEYIKCNAVSKRNLLLAMNPRKFQICQYLIDFHEKRGDKIIVFSDNVYALEKYARKLKRAFIYGSTPHTERMQILENFKHNENINTIFLSKVGDTSLDLPEATCVIQISSHYGSRRQEAQRLGRILRAKRRDERSFNAFFYSLVSKYTIEAQYAAKRQSFLLEQGYAFKIITEMQEMKFMNNLAYTDPNERQELLKDVRLQCDSEFRGNVKTS